MTNEGFRHIYDLCDNAKRNCLKIKNYLEFIDLEDDERRELLYFIGCINERANRVINARSEKDIRENLKKEVIKKYEET